MGSVSSNLHDSPRVLVLHRGCIKGGDVSLPSFTAIYLLFYSH